MADKPSRALVVYGDGLARFIDPSHTHLHSLASMASCGFLSLPNSPSTESEDERVVREFAILMDSCEAYLNSKVETQNQSSSIPTISERFMGMKAAVITRSPSLESFGSRLGLTALKSDEFARDRAALLDLLGFRDGKAIQTSRFDLVFLHFGADDKAESVNSVVGEIMELARPGSEIGSRLHFSVVTSFGAVTQNDDPSETSVLISVNEKLSALLPRQSYTMRGEIERTDVRHYCPMLLAQLQYGVTRKDLAETFSFGDFKERCGNLVIPADRFLHEVAFKLWKAPKYGA